MYLLSDMASFWVSMLVNFGGFHSISKHPTQKKTFWLGDLFFVHESLPKSSQLESEKTNVSSNVVMVFS